MQFTTEQLDLIWNACDTMRELALKEARKENNTTIRGQLKHTATRYELLASKARRLQR